MAQAAQMTSAEKLHWPTRYVDQGIPPMAAQRVSALFTHFVLSQKVDLTFVLALVLSNGETEFLFRAGPVERDLGLYGVTETRVRKYQTHRTDPNRADVHPLPAWAAELLVAVGEVVPALPPSGQSGSGRAAIESEAGNGYFAAVERLKNGDQTTGFRIECRYCRRASSLTYQLARCFYCGRPVDQRSSTVASRPDEPTLNEQQASTNRQLSHRGGADHGRTEETHKGSGELRRRRRRSFRRWLALLLTVTITLVLIANDNRDFSVAAWIFGALLTLALLYPIAWLAVRLVVWNPRK